MASFRHYDEFEEHQLKATALLTILGNQSEISDLDAHSINSVAMQIHEHINAMSSAMEKMKEAVDPETGKLKGMV